MLQIFSSLGFSLLIVTLFYIILWCTVDLSSYFHRCISSTYSLCQSVLLPCIFVDYFGRHFVSFLSFLNREFSSVFFYIGSEVHHIISRHSFIYILESVLSQVLVIQFSLFSFAYRQLVLASMSNSIML